MTIEKIRVALTWLKKAAAVCGKAAIVCTTIGAACEAAEKAGQSIVSLLDTCKATTDLT